MADILQESRGDEKRLPENDRLLRFFEILIKVDQRQKEKEVMLAKLKVNCYMQGQEFRS